MRAVTYYTAAYAHHLKRWEETIRPYCRTYAEKVADRQTWRRTAGYKPQFLLGCRRRFGEPLLWVDVDAWMVESPTALDGAARDWDFAAYIRPPSHPADHQVPMMQTGTLWANTTAAATRILESWAEAERQLRDVRIPSERLLYPILMESGARILRLPKSYCYMIGQQGPRVIVHRCASLSRAMRARVRRERARG